MGQADATNYCGGETTRYALAYPALSCESTSTTLKAILGFQSNRWFGIEFGYADLGKAKASATSTGVVCNPTCGPWQYTVNDTIKSKGFEFVGVGTIPLDEDLSLLGKFGLLHWTVTGSGALSGAVPAGYTTLMPVPAVYGATDTGNSAIVGIGLKFKLGEKFVARGEYEATPAKIGTAATGQTKLQIFSASLLYLF